MDELEMQEMFDSMVSKFKPIFDKQDSLRTREVEAMERIADAIEKFLIKDNS